MKDRIPGILVRYRSSFAIAVCMIIWTVVVTEVIDASVPATMFLMTVIPFIALTAFIMIGSIRAGRP